MPYLAMKAILDSHREEQRIYYSLPPVACFCGAPLVIGWKTVPGGGRELHRKCPDGSAAEGHVDWVGGNRPV